MAEPKFEYAAMAADIPGEGILAVDCAGMSIVLCGSGGEVFALENRCSHTGQPLERGIVRNGWIMCPFHGARFDLATGEPLREPAQCPVRTFPARVIGGAVEVAIERE